MRFVLVLALLATSPIDKARKHLEAGQLDDVLFTLQGGKFEGADKAEAASVLARAAQKSLAKKDSIFALQFAQMSLEHDASHPLALELAARACLAQKQFTPAEEYADRWIGVQKDGPAPRLLRAEIAFEQGDWDKVLALTTPLSDEQLDKKQRARRAHLREVSETELAERQSAMSEVKSLEAQMIAAQERAAENPASTAGTMTTGASARSADVILYRTAWCGYCTRAQKYLAQKGVSFVEKDIEKDAQAAQELAQKKARAGIRSNGVPVIDVKGELVLGFDRPRLEQLLD